jgi:KaiC/GvpD/RAD55 family RecA-like ATPase
MESPAGLREESAGSLRTGFSVLDHVLEGGLRAGDLTLVGGPPGVGKTVVTLQWARNFALVGIPSVYASYEHDERALFGRILHLEVGSLPVRDDPPGDLRRAIRDISRGRRSLRAECVESLHLRAASGRIAAYQDRLSLFRGSSRTGLDELEEMIASMGPGPSVLFVDYLQKIPVPGVTDSEERVRIIGERLKDVAMTHEVAVIAVVAGDHQGLRERRLRLHHIFGAAALGNMRDT